MKVLLLEDIEKTGYLGDVVEVKDGFARNYLVPYGLATIPTEDAIRRIAEAKAQRAAERRAAAERLANIAEEVNGAEVSVEVAANDQGHLFGSVTAAQIGSLLRDAKFEISDDMVVLKDHLKEVGEYEVTLKLAADITATVKVTVVAQGEKVESEEDTDE